MLARGVKLPTKSEIIALGLRVNGTYSNNQLVQERDIINPVEYDGKIIVSQDGTYEITGMSIAFISDLITSKTLKANDVYCRYKTKILDSSVRSFTITYTYNGGTYESTQPALRGNISLTMTLNPSKDKFITDPGVVPGV